MRKTITKLIPTEITTYTCDICFYTTENNTGCCGDAPLMSCGICGVDVCRNCRECYVEDYDADYCDIIVCVSCDEKFNYSWEWALENTGRNEAIDEVAKEHYAKQLKK